jgi:two-component system copper resistance phosphate regulon response regulator CusR
MFEFNSILNIVLYRQTILMDILIIEDDLKVMSFIKKGLEEHGYIITAAYDGQTGRNAAVKKDFDLVILDIMLPHFNGFQVCRYIREHKKELPILILTALAGINDKIEAFESGADDYLTKPFHFEELLIRVKALIRRQLTIISSKPNILGDLAINSAEKRVFRKDKEIFLSLKEFTLLEVLIANKGRVLSRAFIAQSVWGIDFTTGSNVVDVYINYLRNKIDKGFSKKLIHTVTGMGYVLKEE